MDTAREFVYDSWAHQDRVLGGGAAGEYGVGAGQALTGDPEPGIEAEGRGCAGLEAPRMAQAAHCQASAANLMYGQDAMGSSNAAAEGSSNAAADAPQPSAGRSLAHRAWPGAVTPRMGWAGQAGADPDWAQTPTGRSAQEADRGGCGAAQGPHVTPQLLRRPGLEAVDWLLVCNAVLIASTRLKAGCFTDLAPSLQLLHAMARALPCQG